MFPPEEHPFLTAIAARPADDEPRLVYADYLEETGLPKDAARAELIRIQIALRRLPLESARLTLLAERETELLEAYRPEWTAPLARLGVRFHFRRGLPDTVAIDAATFLARGEELFDNTSARPGQSFIARVRLSEVAGVLPALAACPLLSRIEELDLASADLGNGGLARLLESTQLRPLRVLELGQNRLDDAGAALLARTVALPKLEVLALPDNEIGSEGAACLADSPHLAGLLELDLGGNAVTESGVRALAQPAAWPRLKKLDLASNPLGAGFTEFVRSRLFARLAASQPALAFSRCSIESAGAEALAGSPALQTVEHLELSENYLGDAGAIALGSRMIANLRTLRLARNQIGDRGAEALLAAALPRLDLLDLANNRLTRRGLDAVKAAAKERNFTAITANNATETTIALPTPPAAETELERVVELKRGLAHPARPGT